MRVRVGFLLLLAAAVSVRAQHREEITVQLIDVPVYVRRGVEPVAGLTRENFELFVNGKPQPIDYFDVIDFGVEDRHSCLSGTGTSACPPLQPRRHFVFVIDLYFSNPGAIARAQRAAADMIARSGASDVFAIATFTSGGGIQFLTPFTQNQKQTLRALETFHPMSIDDPARVSVTNDVRVAVKAYEGSMLNQFEGGGRGDRAAGEIIDPFTGGSDAMQENRMRPLQRVAELQVSEMRALGRRLAPLRGQKHVILMSQGFAPALFIDPKFASSYLHESIQRLYRDYHASGTLLHALDIAGLRHNMATVTLSNEVLRIFSLETGGEFLHNTNSLGVALASLSERHSVEYRIGFRPRTPRNGYNRIVVKLKGVNGAQVSYRRGFTAEVAR